MILLTPTQTASLRDWFLPERPGPLIGLHVIQTGNGSCFVDRWPDPRVVLVETAGNYSLSGDPGALSPKSLEARIHGVVETSPGFIPLLKAAFPDVRIWDRVVLERQTVPSSSPPINHQIRRLGSKDAYHLWGFSHEVNWISKTWGGPLGLASSGSAWGASVGGRLASVACTFFRGEKYEEVGIVTEPEFRGLGLSVACAAALCEDIQGRGRQPSWTTSPDNFASLRVAEKLGFVVHRYDRLYVIGVSIPESPRRQSG